MRDYYIVSSGFDLWAKIPQGNNNLILLWSEIRQLCWMDKLYIFLENWLGKMLFFKGIQFKKIKS